MIKVGDMVRVKGRGRQNFMVITLTEHTVRVKQFPVIDAPPAEEVLRSEVITSDVTTEEGDE